MNWSENRKILNNDNSGVQIFAPFTKHTRARLILCQHRISVQYQAKNKYGITLIFIENLWHQRIPILLQPFCWNSTSQEKIHQKWEYCIGTGPWQTFLGVLPGAAAAHRFFLGWSQSRGATAHRLLGFLVFLHLGVEAVALLLGHATKLDSWSEKMATTAQNVSHKHDQSSHTGAWWNPVYLKEVMGKCSIDAATVIKSWQGAQRQGSAQGVLRADPSSVINFCQGSVLELTLGIFLVPGATSLICVVLMHCGLLGKLVYFTCSMGCAVKD